MSNYSGPEQDLNLQPEEKGTTNMDREAMISAVCAAGIPAGIVSQLSDSALKELADAVKATQGSPATMGGIGGFVQKPAPKKNYMAEGGTVGQLATLAAKMAERHGPAFGNMQTVAAAFIEAKRKDRGLTLAKFSERVTNK